MVELLDRLEVQRWLQDGAQLVDVLPSSQYEDVHLPGAVNLPLKRVDEAPDVLEATRAVVVYCSNSL